MGKGRSRGGIRQIVGGHVNGLHRGNRALGGGCNALLHRTHVRGKRRLVTDGRGNASEQGRHLRAGLSEPENVVNEEEHVLALNVTEILCDSETGEGDTGAGTRGLVHLSVHKRHLRTGSLEVDDAGLDHFVVKIVALTGALADTGKHRVTTVRLSDVVDELLDEHSLADTGTTKETNLASLGIRGKEVDDLNASDQNLGVGAHLHERGGLCVDGQLRLRVDGATLVNGLTNDVHNASQGVGADGDLDGGASVDALLAADETLRAVHGNGTDRVLTEMLGDLKNKTVLASLNLEGVKDRGERIVELDVDDGTNDGHDATRLGRRKANLGEGPEGRPEAAREHFRK
eukprot:Opistho-2@64579